jgi:hypothetical protein
MQRVYTLRLGRESLFGIVKELFLANLQLTGLCSHQGPYFKAILMAGGKLTLLRSLLGSHRRIPSAQVSYLSRLNWHRALF